VSPAQTLAMSPEAERLQWLRAQRDDLRCALELQLTAGMGRSRAARWKRCARENLARVDEILRQLANFIITGRYA
jgi:hypothetical protein